MHIASFLKSGEPIEGIHSVFHLKVFVEVPIQTLSFLVEVYILTSLLLLLFQRRWQCLTPSAPLDKL